MMYKLILVPVKGQSESAVMVTEQELFEALARCLERKGVDVGSVNHAAIALVVRKGLNGQKPLVIACNFEEVEV